MAELTPAKKEAFERLAQISDGALREVCDLTDDLMVIFHKHGDDKTAELFRNILIDVVMEEERRNA